LQLNWTTFFFEIINFLVLVWILKIFLYQPILKVLSDRRSFIDNSLAEAKTLQQQATELEQKYQSRLDDWELEKQKLLDQLQQEIQIERSSQFEQLAQQLSEEREKVAVIEQRQQAETMKQYQQKSHTQGARFASRLLTSIASPELESRLIDSFIDNMNRLTEDTASALTSACESIDQITVTSAYALTESQQKIISITLSNLCHKQPNYSFLQAPELLAGLRIGIGAWVLRFNLQDELSSFSELNHDKPVS